MKKISTLFFAVISFCIFKTNTVTAQVNVQDSLALVDLYNSTDGPHWTYNDNWLTAAPVSTWEGVYVSDDRVYSLLLYNTGLNGSIPASFGNLTHLKAAYLYNNNLSGHIPSSFGNLDSLIYVELNFNQLTGNIPPELGNLSNLVDLDLNNNQLSGSIPTELGNLSNLTGLSLNNNNLSGSIPASLGNLTKLIGLLLNNNDLTGNIPPELGNLVNLQGLYLDHNQLSGSIPPELGNLIQLYELNISSNQISGHIPAELGNLSNLHYLILYNNQLSGSIPTELGNLSSLVELLLNNNQLSGSIPTELGNLSNLVILYLTNNQLSDTIPGSLSKLRRAFEQLSLSYNKFTFAGMGRIARNFPIAEYWPQAIIPLHDNDNTLSVSVGSIPYNNTYNWYKDGVLYKTKVGDSTLTPTSSGAYYVTVTNSIATQLTLYSDIVNITDDLIAAEPSELNTENNFTSNSLYPNPAKTSAMLSFNADGKYTITITDVSGKILQIRTGAAIKGSNIIQLDVRKYASGIYLVTITDEKNRKQTLRLSKE